MKPIDESKLLVNTHSTPLCATENVPKITPEGIMEMAKRVTFSNPNDFYNEVRPMVDPILEAMQTEEFITLSKRCANWEFLFELRREDGNIVHYILGSNHGINYQRIQATEDDIIDVAQSGMVSNAWTEIDPETALPKTFDMRIIKKLKGLKAVLPMETTALHDVILNNLSNLLVDHVKTSIDTMTEMVKGLNKIVADLFVSGNAHLNWFMYRMSWMMLMGKQGYKEHEEVLLQNRNIQWARRVLPKLAVSPEPHIIVCGCNHLFGHHGMLQLLKRGGWNFSPVPVVVEPPTTRIPFPEFARTLRKIQTENRQNTRMERRRQRRDINWLQIPLLILILLAVLLLTYYILSE